MHFPGTDATLDVLVVGSVNLDTGLTLPRMVHSGETIESTAVRRSGGGKGANQALAARQLGARAALLAAVGGDAAEALRDLDAAGVRLDTLVRFPDEFTGTAVLLVTPDDNAIVTAPGANALLAPEHVTAVSESHPAPAVVALQHEVPHDVVAAAIEAWSGRSTVVLNPSPFREVEQTLLDRVDLVVVNRIELGQLLHAPEPDSVEASQRLLESSGLRAAIVTLGADGVLVLERGAVTRLPTTVVDAVDTVGAGDAFLGGVAAALATGADLIAAARRAAAAAALAVTVHGARNPDLTPDAVDVLLAPPPAPERPKHH